VKGRGLNPKPDSDYGWTIQDRRLHGADLRGKGYTPERQRLLREEVTRSGNSGVPMSRPVTVHCELSSCGYVSNWPGLPPSQEARAARPTPTFPACASGTRTLAAAGGGSSEHAASGSSRNWNYQIPGIHRGGYRSLRMTGRLGRSIGDPEGPQPSSASTGRHDCNLMDYLHVTVSTGRDGGRRLRSSDYAFHSSSASAACVADAAAGGVEDKSIRRWRAGFVPRSSTAADRFPQLGLPIARRILMARAAGWSWKP